MNSQFLQEFPWSWQSGLLVPLLLSVDQLLYEQVGHVCMHYSMILHYVKLLRVIMLAFA
jgi:hypothetical protein